MIKRHLISMGITFVGSFALVLGAALSQDSFVFSKAAIISTVVAAALAGVRAVAKIVWELGSALLTKKE